MLESAFENKFYQARFDLHVQDGKDTSNQTFHLVPAQPTEISSKPGQPVSVTLPPELALRMSQPDAFACFGFAKDNSARNCYRYFITYQPSLWQEYTVFRQWGRAGSDRLLSRTEYFADANPAQKRVCRLVRRRLRRGYHLAFAA